MPDPVPNSPAATSSWADVPGGDVPFGDLFGSDPEASVTSKPEPQTTPDPAAAKPEPQTPDPEPQKFRIETKTGTVYDSLEAATKGTEEKDTLIRQLRDQIIATTGADPLAKKPPAPTEDVSYLRDPQRYARDLAEAASKGDAAKYAQVQLRLVDEYIAPVKPLFQDFSRTRAQAQISSEIKDFESFKSGPEFQKVLSTNPVLANAIQGAESDFRYSNQLPELYRLAYSEYTRQRLPELLKAQQATQPVAPTQPVRPTVSSSTLSPTDPVTQASRQEMLRTKEGRDQIKRDFESSGQQNTDWSNIRW